MKKIEILGSFMLQQILQNFLQNGESMRESIKISKFGELSKNDYYEREITFYHISPTKSFEIKYLGVRNVILLSYAKTLIE